MGVEIIRQKILLVDDDRKTVELVRLYLENDGYQVFTAMDGQLALSEARKSNPDLIVLDLMLPKIDGLDVCRQIRAESNIPIIMLTARTTEEDKLAGLDIGADDYITKPFSPREVLARVRAVLRRISTTELNDLNTQQVFEDITIDYQRRDVRVRGKFVHLTPKEFKLLEIMSKQPGQIFSRTFLLERAFGSDYAGLERTIDVHVMNLRKKLEQNAPEKTYIKTIYGMGYKFSEEDDVA